ncbi:multicilin [Clupea harengus]|uniref:Multicilin n=1 Tax=Clupea harengus TaxID=7950 RepID=A0A6P8G306_CLUHA|nr:multicilin [Clupea harengus]
MCHRVKLFRLPQLHITLQRKQDEISALREKNSQLKELAKQAERLALLLDVRQVVVRQILYDSCMPLSQGVILSHDAQWHKAKTLIMLAPLEIWCFIIVIMFLFACVCVCVCVCVDDSGSVSAHNSITEDTVGYHGDAKRRKDDDDELLQAQLQQYLEDIERDLQQPEADSVVSQEDPTKGQKSDTINVYGTFCGLQIVRTTPTPTDTDSSEREVMCFKTSIREHSTIRTRVFPHGQSFTSPTPTGGYRFLWIPTEP